MSDASPPPQPKPNRRFWQIHLSTLLVAAIAAGVLLGCNLKLARRFKIDDDELHYIVYRGWAEYGWPVTAYRADGEMLPEQPPSVGGQSLENSVDEITTSYPTLRGSRDVFYLKGQGIVFADHTKMHVIESGIAINIGVALAMILPLIVVAEWFARRRMLKP